MMTLTKANLIKQLVNATFSLSKEDATLIVNSFFEEISLALEKGKEVKFTNFGKFIVRKKKKRAGRNPRTGEYALISARKVVTYNPSGNLKAEIARKNIPSK
jgi:integration host factor subunit alpha